MKHIALTLCLAVPLVLSGCDMACCTAPGSEVEEEIIVDTFPDPNADHAPEAACVVEKFQYLVGQPLSAAEDIDHKGAVRVLGERDAMTMDYRVDRLNIEHDAGGTILRVFCG